MVDRRHLLAVLEQLADHSTSDVSGCSGNQDHDRPFIRVLLRQERSWYAAIAAGKYIDPKCVVLTRHGPRPDPSPPGEPWRSGDSVCRSAAVATSVTWVI